MRKLNILIGIPGSGKSTYALSITGSIVSTDVIRKSLYGDESILYSEDVARFLLSKSNFILSGFSEKEIIFVKSKLCEEYIFQLARNECRKILSQNRDVIHDSTNHKLKYRKAIIEECCGSYDYCYAHFLDVSLETALKRNQERQRHESVAVIKRVYDELERPNYNEGFQNIFTISD